MRIWSLMVALALVGSLAHAQSLGEIAKRERERREKNKQQGASTQTKVIHDEDLAAAPGKDAKGTFNPASGFTRGAGGAGAGRPASPPVPAAPSPSASPSGSGERLSEVDTRRAGARQTLESSYRSIAAMAYSLWEAALEYQKCAQVVNRNCAAQEARVGSLAVSVAINMDQAEDAARQGWLDPGEVRDARQRHGMDHAFWDRLVRAVRQYSR
jgi:hypothetical protein